MPAQKIRSECDLTFPELIPVFFGKASYRMSKRPKNIRRYPCQTRTSFAKIATKNSCLPKANKSFTLKKVCRTNPNVAPNAAKPKKRNSTATDSSNVAHTKTSF